MNQPATTRWVTVWVATGAGIIAAAHIGKLPPALPMIRAELGLDLVTAGWVASIFSATGFALGLVAGSLADRIGLRRVALFAIVALAAGSLLGSFATTGGMLLAARFIEGIGFAAVTISAAAIIAQITHPGDRKRVLGGIWAAYFPIGFGSFLLIAPIVVDSYGWRVLWQAGSVITLLWLPVFWRATGDLPAERRQGGGPGLFRNIALTLARPGALLVAACFALYAAQHVAFVIWLPTMIIDARGTSLFIAAAVPAAVLAFNAGGIILGGWVMGRGVPVWLLMVIGGVGMGIAEFVIFSGATPDGARLVLAMMFGLFGGLIPAASLAAAPVYTPSPAQIGTINGLLVMATNTGQLFGPPALAAVKEAEGSWESTSWLMLSLAAAIVALALISRPVERKAEMRLKG